MIRNIFSVALLLAAAPLFGQSASPAQEHAERGLEFAQRGDLKSAEAELRKAVELAPNDAALLTSLGGILGMEGDLPQANVYLAKAVKLNPQDAAPRRNLAANQWQLGKLKEAHENLERLLRGNPQDKVATFLLGMVSEKEKDYARSARLLLSVPEIMERQPDGWAALASACYHTNRREEARGALEQLLSRAAPPASVFRGARVAMDAGDYATAETLLRSVRASYADPAAVELQIAVAQYRSGRAADSEKTLQEAMQAGRANSEAYVLLAKIQSERGADVRALETARQGAQAFPDSFEMVSAKAALEMRLQYFNDAVSSYQQTAKLKPDSSEARRDLATAQWRAGMRKDAVAAFEQSLRQFPRDAQTCQVYGMLLLGNGSPENKPRAVELLERAVALDEKAVEPRYQLANLALADGRPEQALPLLEKAIQLDAKDSRLHFALSRVYRRLGRSAEAERESETYQKLKAAEGPAARSSPAPETSHQ
jgi:tetratricopeptide (TPR) repeat protein